MEIKALKLNSKNFEAQLAFYTALGFEILDKGSGYFTIQAGKSKLTFDAAPEAAYYHFAFNIPSFQIKEALSWAKQHVNILPFEGNEILDFVNWNAEAFYFFDANHNIVELIARKNLNYPSVWNFSAQSILEISEMGLPVPDIRDAFQQLSAATGIVKYSGDFDRFCAAGDEYGLFIIVKENEKNWLPTDIPAIAFPFEIEFEVGTSCFKKYFDGNLEELP